VSYSPAADSVGSSLADATGAAASVDSVAAGVVAAWVGFDEGVLVGAAGVVLAVVGATYGVLPEPLLLLEPDEPDEPDDPVVWWPLAVLCEPLEWLPPLLWLPLLCSVEGLWVGFLVGLWLGLGVDGGGGACVAGGGGATVAVGGFAVGVFWVGAAATGARFAVSPEPAALCGHQATRHAAVARSAATATRTKFVQVLLTTPSLAP
jgi:hypothetical protein